MELIEYTIEELEQFKINYLNEISDSKRKIKHAIQRSKTHYGSQLIKQANVEAIAHFEKGVSAIDAELKRRVEIAKLTDLQEWRERISHFCLDHKVETSQEFVSHQGNVVLKKGVANDALEEDCSYVHVPWLDGSLHKIIDGEISVGTHSLTGGAYSTWETGGVVGSQIVQSFECGLVGGGPPKKHRNAYKKKKNKDHKLKQAYNDRGTFKIARLQPFFPDVVREKFTYGEIPTQRFLTAAQQGSISYNANSMGVLFTGGSPAVIPYYDIQSGLYTQYRVLRSKIVVKLLSREATKGMEVCLALFTGAAPVINSAAEYSNMRSLKGAQAKMLCPLGSGPNAIVLSRTIDLSKVFGPNYLTGAEYSAAAAGTPTTLAYWCIAYYNADLNTVTTGGVNAQVTLTQDIEMFNPDRTEAVAINADPDNPGFRLPRTKIIAKQIEVLTAELSSLNT